MAEVEKAWPEDVVFEKRRARSRDPRALDTSAVLKMPDYALARPSLSKPPFDRD